VTADCELHLLLSRLRGQQNLTNELIPAVHTSVIGARPRNVASLARAGYVTLKHSVRMRTSITARPLVSLKMRTFGAGLSVACACISESERATLRPEEPAAFERYRTVGTNYIPLSEYERSGEGASNH